MYTVYKCSTLIYKDSPIISNTNVRGKNKRKSIERKGIYFCTTYICEGENAAPLTALGALFIYKK